MTGTHPPGGADLQSLADDLETLTFDLSGAAAEDLRRERDRLSRLLRGVVRRTAEPRAPLLVVVGGGSGAGKSTTVNTLAGSNVAAGGVIRPTTRVPTLVCHPDDRAWFVDDRVLPGLVRTDASGPGPASTRRQRIEAPRRLRLAVSAQLPPGVALLDTPDIDSVELTNHRLADEALDAADAWVWLATARTYADEIGMSYLRRARDRQASTVVVITQVRPDEAPAVLADVDRLLEDERIAPDRRMTVPFAEVTDGRLPASVVEDLAGWLAGLAPTDRRVEVRRRAHAGLLRALPGELAPLQEALENEREAAGSLTATVAKRYAALPGALDAELAAGLSLRAEVLDRWQRVVGGNETLLRIQNVIGHVGDLVRTGLGRPAQDDTRRVRVEIAGELTRIVSRLLEHTAGAVRRDLESDETGRALLNAHPELRLSALADEHRVRAMIADWEEFVAEQIETVGGPRKAQARRRSTALNAVATSAILVLFAVSGGLTGGEVGIAAAAAAGSQWLLVRMLGEHNVRRLLEDIGSDLADRVVALAETDRQRFDQAIAASAPSAEVLAALLEARRSAP